MIDERIVAIEETLKFYESLSNFKKKLWKHKNFIDDISLIEKDLEVFKEAKNLFSSLIDKEYDNKDYLKLYELLRKATVTRASCDFWLVELLSADKILKICLDYNSMFCDVDFFYSSYKDGERKDFILSECSFLLTDSKNVKEGEPIYLEFCNYDGPSSYIFGHRTSTCLINLSISMEEVDNFCAESKIVSLYEDEDFSNSSLKDFYENLV